MIVFLQVLHVILCILLILIILMQAGKGHGLAGAFGSFAGGAAQNLFGARTTDVLTKFTSYLVGFFFISTLLLAFLQVKESTSVVKDYKASKVQVSEVPTEGAQEVGKKLTDFTDKLLSGKKDSKSDNNSEVKKDVKDESSSKNEIKDIAKDNKVEEPSLDDTDKPSID